MPFDGLESPQVTDALLAVRRRIRRGWCQGPEYRLCWTRLGPGREFCLTGAVLCDPHSDHRRILLLLKMAILELRGEERPAIFPGDLTVLHYNEAPGRTKAEVLAVVDRAIAISRGELQ